MFKEPRSTFNVVRTNVKLKMIYCFLEAAEHVAPRFDYARTGLGLEMYLMVHTDTRDPLAKNCSEDILYVDTLFI